MKEFVFFIICILFSLYPLAALPSFYDDLPDADLVDRLVAEMSDHELLGQIFFLGYHGLTPSSYSEKWISERQLGGVKVFSRNMEELEDLSEAIYEMQSLAAGGRFHIPLFIATDQEGGWVRHIWKDVLVVPGNLALGASPVLHDAYTTGYDIGRELAILGINMNFAPTVDVYSHPQNTAIGPRSFSSDPVQTGILACAYFQGMTKAGIICTAKHFPGHGGAEEDSHGILPKVHVTYEELWDRELVPYRFLIKEGLPAIMTGHLSFPDIHKDKTPATLSSFFLQEVLRDRLRFQGIVITDDLEMYGAHPGKIDIPEVTPKAVFAGNDMILISHREKRQESAWQTLSHLMKTDSTFRDRVKESVRRILMVKCRAFKGDSPSPVFPDYKNAADTIRKIQEDESLNAVFQGVCRSMTVIKKGVIPYAPRKNEKILLVGQYPEFLEEGKKRFPHAHTYEYSYYPAEWSLKTEREKIGELTQTHDTVVFLLVNYNSVEILTSIKPYNRQIIVISSLTPVYVNELPWVETAVAAYGTGRESFEAAFAVLCGDFDAEGKLPVRFESSPGG